MKLKIRNNTDFRTDDLRALARRALIQFAPDIGYYNVSFYWRKPRSPFGYGNYGIAIMQIGIDHEWKNQTHLTLDQRIRLVNTIEHEIEHNEGSHHCDMQMGHHFELDAIPWVEDVLVRLKPSAVAKLKKPTAQDRVDAREAKARKDLARWEAELLRREKSIKAAKKKISFYRRIVRYYDKRHKLGLVAAEPRKS